MGQKAINEEGNRYGYLTVLYRDETKLKKVIWVCLCDCGNITRGAGTTLRRGFKVSCGCYGNAVRREARIKKLTTHGMWRTSEYKTWDSIRQRCTNPKTPTWNYYGGKGITICEEWLSFTGFLFDMGLKPTVYSHIHRLDSNKGYYKENCIWLDKKKHSSLHGKIPNKGQFRLGNIPHNKRRYL